MVFYTIIFYLDEELIKWGWPEDVWYVCICCMVQYVTDYISLIDVHLQCVVCVIEQINYFQTLVYFFIFFYALLM